jgi:hypothetical protein
MAGKWMLARRNVESTLYLGVRPQREVRNQVDLHAWLQVHEHCIAGGEIAQDFEVLAKF